MHPTDILLEDAMLTGDQHVTRSLVGAVQNRVGRGGGWGAGREWTACQTAAVLNYVCTVQGIRYRACTHVIIRDPCVYVA